MVDTLGLLLAVLVHPADVQDRAGAQLLLGEIGSGFPRLAHLWADAGYSGERLGNWVKALFGIHLEVVKHLWSGVAEQQGEKGQDLPRKPSGFHLLKHRWLVERTFAWMGRQRRLAKDYEALPESEEAWCYLAMVRLMLKRLAQAP